MSAARAEPMRIRWRAIGAIALLLVGAPASAGSQPIQAGELLVSLGDELWRVDPESGASARFSPPVSAPLLNLIGEEGIRQLAIDPDGAIFAVTDGRVLEIDPATGAQRVLRARERICVQEFCTYLEGDLDVGTYATGIDLNEDPAFDVGGAPTDLFVGSAEGIYRVTREGGEVSSFLAVIDNNNDFQLRGPLVASAVGGALYGAGGGFYRVSSPPTPILIEGPELPGSAYALDSRGATVVVATRGCNPVGAGVHFASSTASLPLTQGGLLRCPSGVAIDPSRSDRIWVADRGEGVAPDNVLVRLDYDGVAWKQTLFAELPSSDDVQGIAISPVTFAPEPGALALGAAALLALAGAPRR